MTTANKITLVRMFLIPIMVLFMYIPMGSIKWINGTMEINQLIVAGLFVVAAFTDFLDGYIARKHNQITTFGKFLDPIADKVLVLAGMLYIMVITSGSSGSGVLSLGRIPLWTVMIVIFREFSVTGLRLIAVDKGKVIAASPYGKVKTATTMIALIIMLFNDFGLPLLIGDITWYVAVFFTLLSGVDYIYKNREIVFESM